MAVDTVNGVDGYIVDLVGTETHYVPLDVIDASDIAAFESVKAAQASVAGHADINIGDDKVVGDDPVIADGSYKLQVSVDGADLVDIDITTLTTDSYTKLIVLLDAALTGATASIVGGNLRITSDDVTNASKIVIAEGTSVGLLAAMTDFVALDAPVDGSVLVGLAAESRINVTLDVMYAEAVEVFDSLGSDELLAGADLVVGVSTLADTQNLLNAVKAKINDSHR